MKYIICPVDFLARVGILSGLRRTHGLDLDGSMLLDFFYADKIDELKEFVKNHAEYHIVSFKGGVYFNKFVEDSLIWFLAAGDADAELTCAPTNDPKRTFDNTGVRFLGTIQGPKTRRAT